MKIFPFKSGFSSKSQQFFLIITFLTYGSFFLLGCNSSESQAVPTKEKENNSPPKSNQLSAQGLEQKGDYSLLFNPDLKNCEFLTVQELAAAINVGENQVATKDNGYYCEYIYTNDKGLVTRFQITNNKIGKLSIEKEIKGLIQEEKDLGKDSRLVEVRKSETGDTWLMMNQNRHVKLLNANYETFTNIGYTPVFGATEKDVDFINATKDEMRNKAFSIANALLKKYRK